MQSAVSLLSYFCMDEFESMAGSDQPDDNIVTRIIKSDPETLDVLNKIMNSPLVASASDEIIYIFEDATILLNMICSPDRLKDIIYKVRDQLFYQLKQAE